MDHSSDGGLIMLMKLTFVRIINYSHGKKSSHQKRLLKILKILLLCEGCTCEVISMQNRTHMRAYVFINSNDFVQLKLKLKWMYKMIIWSSNFGVLNNLKWINELFTIWRLVGTCALYWNKIWRTYCLYHSVTGQCRRFSWRLS